MSVYDTTPKLLVLAGNITKKLLVDITTGAPLDRQLEFANGDEYQGVVYVVDQPGGPGTAFNFYVPVVTGSSLALTDGASIHYADATSMILAQQVLAADPAVPADEFVYGDDLSVLTEVSGGAGLAFSLVITSATLTNALQAVSSIQAVIEIRCVLAGSPAQKLVVVSDAVTINKSALYPPPLLRGDSER
jgi:hypothetical protein